MLLRERERERVLKELPRTNTKKVVIKWSNRANHTIYAHHNTKYHIYFHEVAIPPYNGKLNTSLEILDGLLRVLGRQWVHTFAVIPIL